MEGKENVDNTTNILKGAEEYSMMLQEVDANSNSENNLHAFRTMKEMREDDVLCDVTLLVGQDKIPIKAHRFLLSVFSEYFKVMFTAGLKESAQHVVHLPCVDPDSFRLVLDYFYDGEIKLTPGNVHKLILLANFFGIKNLLNDCCCFINRHNTIKNCTKILEFAVKYDLMKLREHTRLYMAVNLETVQGNNLDFAYLPLDFVFELVQHPRTTICDDAAENEKRLFMLLWNRVSSLPEAGQCEYFPKILKAVHLPVVKPDFLNQIEKKVEHSDEARDLIEEAKKSVDVKETREWYLPRYGSSGPLTLEEQPVPLTVNGEEYQYYSRCVLIKGLPWYIFGERIRQNDGFRRGTYTYKTFLESPIVIEDLNLKYTVLAKTTGEDSLKNTYCEGKAEKGYLQTSSNSHTVNVCFK